MTMPEQKKAVVPRLRFPEFRDAGPWEVKRLGDVLDVRNMRRTASPEVPLFSLTIEQGITEKTDRYNREFLVIDRSNKRYKLVLPGDIVYNPANLRWGAIAVSKVPYPIVVSPIYEVLCPKKHISICHDFIGIALMLPQQISRFASKGQGTLVERIAVKVEDFLDTLIAIPAQIEEQQKIADCLSSLDELIELEAKKLEALQAHKKGLMQQLFPREGETTPRLRFPEFRDAGPWEVKRLGDVLDVRNMRRTASPEVPLFSLTIEQGITEKTDRYNREFLVIDRSNKRYKLVLPGDIVYNPANLRWGAIAVSKVPYPIVVSPIYEVLCPKKHISICHDFIGIALMLPQQISRFASKGQGTLVERIAVKVEDFLDTLIAIPAQIEEQQKIADCLSSLDELIELQAKKLEALQTHKKGLMQQLFPQEIDL
jgi:type I restriction enzyme S subunit